jgi:hypothetical protein
VNAIDVLESAYTLEGDEPQWLSRVIEAAQPQLDEGDGIVGMLYDARRPDYVGIEHLLAPGVNADMVSKLFNFPAPSEGDDLSMGSAFRSIVVSTLERQSTLSPYVHGYLRATIDAYHLRDVRFVNAIDPTHRGCMLITFSRQCKMWPSRVTHRWSLVAAHVAAGLRVRRRLQKWAETADAILTPDGKVEHVQDAASGRAARTALRLGVMAADRARGPLRRSAPDEALAIWRGLIAGSWSLVDHIESDGKRFVLAHRNTVDLTDLRGLTPREREVAGYIALGHSNKVIAYTLGVSKSSVAAYAASARRKLGLSSWRALTDAMTADGAAGGSVKEQGTG